MDKIKLATTWFDGCSGCHMSFLDIDQKLIELADHVDVVYGPLIDKKEFPENVDVALIEGAISNYDDEMKLRIIREKSKLIVSFGDCAVTANVPGMRNQFKVDAIMQRVYIENASLNQHTPICDVPRLFDKARPVHEFVKVDIFLPGCPPPSKAILHAITTLLEGRVPELVGFTRFGA